MLPGEGIGHMKGSAGAKTADWMEGKGFIYRVVSYVEM
jgi:hypothetical protein